MIKNVLVTGLWHQGVVAAACLADWGFNIVAVDEDLNKLVELNKGKALIFEPGLDDLLQKGILNKNLIFSHGDPEQIRNAELILVAHDTPVDENDISDLSGVFSSIGYLIPNLSDGVLIHITAQVPVGTCDEIFDLIRNERPSLIFRIAYSPENLRLGQAISLYRTPMLPVIGTNEAYTFELLKEFYSQAKVEWQSCSLRTAEMLKHALNSFLALSITFANELGNLCDKIGVDGHRMAQLLRLEPRIGSKAMLMPGLGFSGGTLARDIQTLKMLGNRIDIETVLLDGLWEANQRQNKLVVRRLLEYFGGSLSHLRICVLGLTYKPDTSTLRRSAALDIINDLVKAGAQVSASDPMADRLELESYKHFEFHEDFLEAVSGADLLILVTPWGEYKNIDFQHIKNKMKGKLVFDTANLWKDSEIESFGLSYINIGGGKVIGDKV